MYRQELRKKTEREIEKNRNYKKDFELIEALFLRANEIIKESFPNTKLVVLLYQDYN